MAATGWFISLGVCRMHLQVDNRVAAAHWLWEHARPGDRVAVGDTPAYRPTLTDQDGIGHEPGPHPQLEVSCLFCYRDGVNTDGARFVAVDGWELRMPGVPRYDQAFPQRSRWLRQIRERGAPPGLRCVPGRFPRRTRRSGPQPRKSRPGVKSLPGERRWIAGGCPVAHP